MTRLGTKRATQLISVSLTLAFTATGGALLYAQEATQTAAVTPVKIPPAKRFTRQIAQGVELVQEVLEAGNPKGPLVVSVVRVNLERNGVKVEAALGQDKVWGKDATLGRETVSSLAARHKAVVGINAGFFPYAGNPIGLHIQDGELVTEPAYKRTCFILTKKGNIRFAAFDFTGSVETEGGKSSLTINGLNRRPSGTNKTGANRGELLLFTPRFFETTLRAPNRVEVVLSGIKEPVAVGKSFEGKVETITEGGLTPLAKGTVVLSGSGTAGEYLRSIATPGTKLTFRFDLQTADGKPYKDADEITHATAGGPRIVSDGKVDVRLTAEGMSSSYASRHARTAFGLTKDKKLILVAVDGRQNSISRGVTLTELAEIMLRYGAEDAVNMDGGGSTACIVRDQVINAPSDGSQRPVASMLLVHAPEEKEKDSDDSPTSDPPLAEITLKVGEKRTFEADSEDLLWGLKPGGIISGFIRQDGTFYALRPGHSTILATPTKKNGKPKTFRVVVRATTPQPVLPPEDPVPPPEKP